MDNCQHKEHAFTSDDNISFWNFHGQTFLDHAKNSNRYKKRLAVAVDLITRHTIPCSSLDVGTGDGALPKKLWLYGFDVHGTDISGFMLQKAMDNLSGVVDDLRFRFRLTQGDTPPFPGSFALISALGVLPYIGNHPAYIRYLRGMLSEEGILLISCTKPGSMFGFLQLIRLLIKNPLGENWRRAIVNTYKTGIPSGGFVTFDKSQQARSIRELKAALKKSGFDVLDQVSLYHITAFDRAPLNRSGLRNRLAECLGWTHLVVARKSSTIEF